MNGKTVGASMYGPPNTGTVGAAGVDMTGKMAFAELGMGTLMGHLPMFTKCRLTNVANGKTVIGQKLDTGLGGAPVQGHTRATDLYVETAQALDFGTGVGLISFEVVDKGTPTGTQKGVSGSTDAGASSTPAGSSDGAVISSDQRSGLLKGLIWVLLVLGGAAMAGVGVRTALGGGAGGG